MAPANRNRKRSHESIDGSVSSRSQDSRPTTSKRVEELRKTKKRSRHSSPIASLADSDYEDTSFPFSDSDEPLVQIFKCKQCSKEFKSSFSLRSHMIVHAKEKKMAQDVVVEIPRSNTEDARDSDDKLTCQKCAKTFKLKIMLNRHMESCGKKPMISPQKELLVSLEPIDAVLVAKPADPSKKLECEMCTTRFKTPENLEKHMRVVHAAVLKKERRSFEPKTEEKIAIPCIYCRKPFEDYYVHSAHFRSCPKRDDSLPLKCLLCDKEMAKKCTYFAHIKYVHFWPREGKSIEPQSKENFECRMCSKKLGSQEQLITHLAAHMSNIDDGDDFADAESRYPNIL